MTLDATCPNTYTHLKTDDAMIQAAVDAAAENGFAVRIPRMNARTGLPMWVVENAICLHSGSTVYLDNCHLRLADGVFCNVFKNANGRTSAALSPDGRQYDIHIQGFGNALLDGGNHNGLTEVTTDTDGYPNIIENTMIHLHNVERLTVRGLRIIHHRWWGVTCHYCAQGHIADLAFECNVNLRNMDGVDLRAGCNNFLIENLCGSTGDDMLALTNIPYCERYHVAGLDTGLHSVIIRNIRAKLTGNHALVRLLNQGGRRLYNISIDGVIDLSAEGEDFHRPYAAIRIGDMYYNYDKPMAKLGDTQGITVRNVVTRARNAVYIACTLQDALFDNIYLYADGGTGICFNTANAQNITVDNLHYAANSRIPESDRGAIIQTTEDPLEALSGIYFHKTNCSKLHVRSMTMGSGADAVVAGRQSRVSMQIDNLTKNDEATPFIDGDGIHIA